MQHIKYQKLDGLITPNGWIEEFLKRDSLGITGNLDKLTTDASGDVFGANKVDYKIDGYWSSWWVGETEGNWSEAFVSLAFVLNDEELKKRAKKMIYNVLKYQEKDGYIGIYKKDQRYVNAKRSGELWTQSRIMLTMFVYYDFTHDEKVLTALFALAEDIIKHFGPLCNDRSLFENPDEDGSKGHSLMIIEPLLMLNKIKKNQYYINFCEFLYEDFSSHPCEFMEEDLQANNALDPTKAFIGHGPHTCENLRLLLWLYEATEKKIYKTIYNAAMEKLKTNMSLSGSCKSDETIGSYMMQVEQKNRQGHNLAACIPLPTAGYEYCSTTELMYNFALAGSFGDIDFYDMEEWLVMNAALAAKHNDCKSILYLCADNLYSATKYDGVRWDYSPTHQDAAVCCAPNSCKIMPFHVRNMWLRENDSTIISMLYGASTLKAKINNNQIIIKETTNYPFENNITFDLTLKEPVSATLKFRVPKFAKSFKIKLNGKSILNKITLENKNRIIVFKNLFENNDKIQLEFIAEISTHVAPDSSVALSFGTLLYSFDIKTKSLPYHDYDVKGFHDTDVIAEPGFKYNYTLLLNEKSAPYEVSVHNGKKTKYGWDKSPIYLKALMLDEWAKPEFKNLVPIGCTLLRKTAFPAVFENNIIERGTNSNNDLKKSEIITNEIIKN